MQQGVKSSRCIIQRGAGSQILQLHDAAESQILSLHDAAGIKILPLMMQRRVNLAVGSQVWKLWKTP